ncbi:MAG: ATP-grasp domain-containing protein [Dehalococcoidia bacterium]|nr:ATP-grasp domain-containing protein [Dehalococcoidia bacterium]
MSLKVGLVYNEPIPDRYDTMGEAEAIADVLEEVKAVEVALNELGHQVAKVGLVPPLEEVRCIVQGLDVDVYFNLFEGFAGCPETEAMVAGMLAVTGRPYTGSYPCTLSLALDKAKTKEMLMAAGVKTPPYQLLRAGEADRLTLNFPCIVKPVGEDASHGLTAESVVTDRDGLARQLARVCASYGGAALVEEFIDGRELSATIMGNHALRVLSVSEIVYNLPPGLPPLLTFGAKWTLDDVYFLNTDPVCPAQIEQALWDQVAEISLKAYRLVGCRGYARVDTRLGAGGEAYVLEVNPNPDISYTAGAARQAEAIGLTYSQFIDKIIALAMSGDSS